MLWQIRELLERLVRYLSRLMNDPQSATNIPGLDRRQWELFFFRPFPFTAPPTAFPTPSLPRWGKLG